VKTSWLVSLGAALLLVPHCGVADEGLLQIGLEAHADYSPVYPSQSFGASNRALNAVFRLAPGENYKTLEGVWVAVDVGAASPPNRVIAKGTVGKATKGRFKLSLPRGLPVGKYRFDVLADGKPWKSAEFSVVPDIAAPPPGKPQDLIPLKVGQTWNYDFMQQGGAGANISMPGVTPDAQGRYRADVTLKVAATDADGSHVEMRRNNELVFHEWWRLDPKGWSATRRKAGDEVTLLDPPQVLFAWPPAAGKSWYYTPRDKTYNQTYRMWGPLAVKTPAGEKAGYVVFVEQRSKPVNISVERQFVAGLGLVREVIVTAVNDDMVSRQEMILKP
jgi:hypothetical protein